MKAVSFFWIGNEGAYAPLMHNKFCIIDNSILIFGSYNWTKKAKSNHESITVIEEDYNLILDFNQEFDKIKKEVDKQNIELTRLRAENDDYKVIIKNLNDLLRQKNIYISRIKNEFAKNQVKVTKQAPQEDRKYKGKFLDRVFHFFSLARAR